MGKAFWLFHMDNWHNISFQLINMPDLIAVNKSILWLLHCFLPSPHTYTLVIRHDEERWLELKLLARVVSLVTQYYV